MRLFLLLSMSLLCGCGSTSSVRVERSDAAIVKAVSFTFYDNRPEDQKSETTNKAPPNGTKYYYDKMLDPTPPELIRSALQAKLDKALSSRIVILKTFRVLLYDGSLYGRSDFSVKPSEIPLAILVSPLIAIAALESGVDGAKAKKWVSTQIEISIDNRPFSINLSNQYGGHVSGANISATINEALDGLIAKIENSSL
jgi:hypothetical protein